MAFAPYSPILFGVIKEVVKDAKLCTIAFLNEEGDFIIPLKGFYGPQQLEFYLKMFLNDEHKELKSQEKFDAYYKTFKPVFKTD